VRWVVGRVARNPQPPKGGIPNGEEGKGREEEGGEEEIATASSPERGRASAPPFFVSGLGHPVPDPHTPDDIPLLNPIDHVDPLDHVAEDRIAAIEMRLR